MNIGKENVLSALRISLHSTFDRKRGELEKMNIEKQIELFDFELKKVDDFFGFSKALTKEEIYDEIEKYVVVSSRKSANAKMTIVKTWKRWLFESKKETIDWSYSNRYNMYLERIKGWSINTVESIDKSTDQILEHCGNPEQKDPFFVKGLVIGDVQSGKTANYTSLINKAVDANYKVIIVFTGTTNDLRLQTQRRIEAEVLGNKTIIDDGENGPIGVGKLGLDGEPKVSMFTTSKINGDFSKVPGSTAMTKNGCSYLFVIKKNVSPLTNVIKFLKTTSTSINDKDGKLPLPVLIIDDEADLASINTQKKSDLESATSTNRAIRKLIHQNCKKVTYIGYTATPFANIFIKNYKENSENDPEDLFPSDFIITLPTPPDYSGVRDYFGITPDSIDKEEDARSDLFCEITDKDAANFKEYTDKSLPARERVFTEKLPDCLKDAIRCFLIGVGIKVSRGIIENCTMLVNVDVKVIYNGALRDEIKTVFGRIISLFKNDPAEKEKFRLLWETKMKPVSKQRTEESGRPFVDTWDKISEGIMTAIDWGYSDSVKLVTGSNDSDVLDYTKTDHGLYIAVGGNKLSRGLTLEGLSVSFYVRNTKTFDALLQMGRWFGYRKNWIDVCRVYTTKEIRDNFLEAAEMTEAFKKEIALMDKMHSEPRTFGLRLKTASSNTPTARNKMNHATKGSLTYSGRTSQTLDFKYDHSQYNKDITETFLKDVGPLEKSFQGNYVKRDVPWSKVFDYLKKYKTESNVVSFWLEYIKECKEFDPNELSKWTVVLSSLKEEGAKIDIAGYEVKKGKRAFRKGTNSQEGCSVRVMSKPEDFAEVFDNRKLAEEFPMYRPEDQFGKIERYFCKEKAVLGIYFIDIKEPRSEGSDVLVSEGSNCVGLTIWFPVSGNDVKTYIFMNEVLEEQLHNDSDAKNVSLEGE